MSLHRVIAPPPLAIAVHPAPPPKTREEVRKEDEKRRADRDAIAKAAAAAEKKGDGGDDKEKKANGVDEEAKQKENGNGAAEGKDVAATAPPNPEPDTLLKDDTAVKPTAAEVKATKPLPPLRILPPVPHRPLRSRLDLNPSRPYPPIDSDPRGAYNSYAKAMQNEPMFIDVTKDGWLTEQWREKSEREALARLNGEAEKQRKREAAKAKRETVIRKVPGTAEGLILELWNDLVEAPANELSVEAFWARYDWTDPKAEKHLQIMPFEEKEMARAAEIRRVKKEVKAEEIATLARRAAREKDRLAEEEKKKREKEAGEKGEEEGKDVKKGKLDEAKSVEKEKVEKKNEEEIVVAPVERTEAVAGAIVELTKDEPVQVTYKYPVEVEWTREGVEEILATIGLQCAFNTEKPLPAHWSTPAGAYLLLAHNHFLLRVEFDIQFKPDAPSAKFEAVVTNVEDRVFGDMAKAQLMAERKKKDKEYRDRKEREYKEKKEKERKERKDKEKEEGKEGKDTTPSSQSQGKDGKVEVDKRAEKSTDKHPKPVVSPEIPVKSATSAIPLAEVKHVDGEVIPLADAVEQDAKVETGKAIVVLPVKDGEEEPKVLDAKHEEEPVLIGPKLENFVNYLTEKQAADLEEKADGEKVQKPKEAEEDVEKAKDKKAVDAAPKHRHQEPAGFDPVRDADLLVKMLGPDAANIPLADLKAAFATMEHAAAESKAQAKAVGDNRDGPMIWVWHEPCERWRWQNFAAGCAVIEDGAWEERDWKVFADDRGVMEFEEEMEWDDVIERDNHDWTC